MFLTLVTGLPSRAGAMLDRSDLPKHDRLRGPIQHAFMERNFLTSALGLPMGNSALVPEHEVRENAVLMAQCDARTWAKGRSTSRPATGCTTMQRQPSRCGALNRAMTCPTILRRPRSTASGWLTTTSLIKVGVESVGGFLVMLAIDRAVRSMKLVDGDAWNCSGLVRTTGSCRALQTLARCWRSVSAL